MRINKIEIENLNSLKGHWCIDLTNPDYKKNHDLFVICGETGAGKTTILDAITLALYGQTPRQGALTKENEIMTRHTARCMARVEYTCKKGVFVSEFMQNRARDKLDGNLVTASCRIRNITTGEDSGKLAVTTLAQKTADIIHLDYNQFCRSIMLAQGEFESFIKGDERARASILAKLNGTERYREIGKRVCTKASRINKELEQLKSEKDKVEVLSIEEINNLKEERESKQKENKKIKEVEDNNLAALSWLENLENLSKKLTEAEDQRNIIIEKKEQFKETKKIIEKAEKALNCEKDYSILEGLNQENKKSIEDLENIKILLNECEEKIIKVQNEEAVAKASYEELNNQENDLRKLWQEVLRIDSQLKPIAESYSKSATFKKTTENDYINGKESLSEIEQNLLKINNNIKQLSDYLEQHAFDKELKEVIVTLKHKKENIELYEGKLQNTRDNIINNQKALTELVENKKKIEEKLIQLEEKLKDYVSTEFMTVSLLLRNTLEKGKVCPVCGSLSHPACEEMDNYNSSEKSETVQAVTENIATLNRQLQDEKEKLEKNNSDMAAVNEKLVGAEKEEVDCCNILNSESEQIQKLLVNWKNSLDLYRKSTGSESLNKIIEELSVLEDLYETKNNQLQQEQSNLQIEENKKASINLEKLKTVFDDAEKEYLTEKEKYDSLNKKRVELFGEKSVEEEEKLFNGKITAFEKEYKLKQEEKINLEKEKSGYESKVNQLEEQIKNRNEELVKAKKKFADILEKNGFNDMQEFLDARLDNEQLELLKKERDSIAQADTETKTRLAEAKDTYEELKKQKLTSKSREEIIEENEALEQIKKDNSERIGAINNSFEFDEKNKTMLKGLEEEYEKLCEEDALWQEMRGFIGKNTGEDFEVFVESLAFKQLLDKANKYVSAISGRYTLVQKEGKVDFLVHDVNYPDSKEDRPVTNMSGGEKFIISLSLALGIAELASLNVSVDSLFLDEGFGTLSGEPLMEAINALKTLQSSGKMLGIITHVDAVIREFPQRIEAVKKSGGISELRGSGITR